MKKVNRVPVRRINFQAPEKVLIQMAELGVIKTIPTFLVEPLKPGKLKGAFSELEFLADRELAIIKQNYHMVFEKNKATIQKYLNTFGLAANWKGYETHVISVVSFCLALLESSPYSYQERMIKQLKVIFDYYERVDNVQITDMYTGENFIKVWDEIKKIASIKLN